MRPPECEQYQHDGIERGLGADDPRYRSPLNENPPGHRRAFSAGGSWFLGMMLLVAGSTVAMQGLVTVGVIALIAGLATVAGAAVVLMS
jgi:hypothetical protein